MTTSTLIEFLSGGASTGQRPWPRYRLNRAQWTALATHLGATDWALLAVWGEPSEVHAALMDETEGAIAVASFSCPDRRFPALSPARPGAIRMERTVQDLFGLVAEGAVDGRPWLDHGQWTSRAPIAPRAASEYPFLPAEGESLHQIPVGPVHAGIIEPGHFRFHANGETVVRLEERLGYVHKGTLQLMQGKTVVAAARLAGRLSGDSTVAHALAFSRAVEAAADCEPPPRAIWLRALMAEIERIANHIGDVGAVCNDASFAFMQAHCMVLREEVLRAAARCFGHRLMMDRVIPGGVARDLDAAAQALLSDLIARMLPRWSDLYRIYDDKPSLLDRTVGTGIVKAELVRRFAAGGYVGRASARDVDTRRRPGYPPYDQLKFDVPTFSEGDVNARVLVRFREVDASLNLIAQILARLPDGPIAVEIPARAGDGISLVEGFRGDILTRVRLDSEGRVQQCYARDPSWLQWPLLEAAIEGNIVADFPLCNKSFNCSYSGHDL